jgi:tRNA A-37 threonylcarbamoyl transferase component Bud32
MLQVCLTIEEGEGQASVIKTEVEANATVDELKQQLSEDFQKPLRLFACLHGERFELHPGSYWAEYAKNDEVEVVIEDAVSPSLKEHTHVEAGDSSAGTQKLIQAVKTGDLPKVIRVLGENEEAQVSLIIRDEDLFINKPDERGWSALHHACSLGHDRLVGAMLSRGASCNKESQDGWTALQLAASSGFLECVNLLLKHERIQINKMTVRPPALHLACEGGHLEVVRAIIEAGASMTMEDQIQRIPLEASKTQEIAELIPYYMGQQELDKAKFPEKYQPPPPVSGEVYFTSQLVLDDKSVFLFLDLTHGLLCQYPGREAQRLQDEPSLSLPIVVIDDVRRTQSSLPGQLRNVYFIVESKQGVFVYYTKDRATTENWITQILKAVSYCQANKVGPLPSFKKLEASLANSDREPAPYPDMAHRMTVCMQEQISFSSFTILEELGSGTFGTVFKVVKKNTGETFAMKQLSKQMLAKNRQLKYAIAESKIMRSLHHPYIVTLYYAFETPRNLYLVMEFCPNGDLDGLLSKQEKLQEQDARIFIAETVLALEYLHSLSIVYRDLKPANILLDPTGHIQLTDFGLAKENVDALNPAKTFAGSPAYIAPELLSKKGACKESDIYGLGVMLFELLTGNPPYFSDDIQELFKMINRGKFSFPRYVSSEAKDLMNKLMHKDSKKRPNFIQIKSHLFFRGLDWQALYERRIPAPQFVRQPEPVGDVVVEEEDEFDDPLMLVMDQDYAEGMPRDKRVEGFSYSKGFGQ